VCVVVCVAEYIAVCAAECVEVCCSVDVAGDVFMYLRLCCNCVLQCFCNVCCSVDEVRHVFIHLRVCCSACRNVRWSVWCSLLQYNCSTTSLYSPTRVMQFEWQRVLQCVLQCVAV